MQFKNWCHSQFKAYNFDKNYSENKVVKKLVKSLTKSKNGGEMLRKLVYIDGDFDFKTVS